ncbi:MAG: hypothetical protein JSS10_07400 [Verrucomicrobia bacterium]|nr:hypothetical protein [Verrucomicrobiota bacterium]
MSTQFSVWAPSTWAAYASEQMERAADAAAETIVDAAVKKGMADKVAKAVVESGALDQLAAQTPQYQEYQTRIQEYAEHYERYTTAGMYASITGGTVGICLTLTGRAKAGYTLIVVSLPMGYFSYNANKVYENLENDFANNIIQHMSRKNKKDQFDQKKLRETLKKGTLCYDPFIEFHARHFMAHMASLEKIRAKKSSGQ